MFSQLLYVWQLPVTAWSSSSRAAAASSKPLSAFLAAFWAAAPAAPFHPLVTLPMVLCTLPWSVRILLAADLIDPSRSRRESESVVAPTGAQFARVAARSYTVVALNSILMVADGFSTREWSGVTPCF